jgi:hypothetical protein
MATLSSQWIDNRGLAKLKEFNKWCNGTPPGTRFTLLDFLGCVGTPDLLYAVAELFWPSLVEFGGRHFIAAHFSKELYRDWKTRLGSEREIQKIMNHIHMRAVLPDDVDDDVAVDLAMMIAKFWSQVFAGLGIVAEASGEDAESAAVTLYQTQE